MYGNGIKSCLFQGPGKGNTVDMFPVPAKADLGCYGTVGMVFDSFDNGCGSFRFLHQIGTGKTFNHFGNRTAHIDINDVAMGMFRKIFSRLTHRIRIRSEQL